MSATTSAPIVLVPGYWLGAWAWDEVVALLEADGHDVVALTLPGLESVDSDRTHVTLADHVDAICAAVESAAARTSRPVVLAVHSGTGSAGYAVTDRLPHLVAHAVYVDSGPGTEAMDPDRAADWQLPSAEQLAEGENLDGLSDEHLARFRRRAVPQPVGTLREAPVLTNDARLDVATTVIATGASSEVYRGGVAEGWGFLLGLRDLHDVGWVDLPTSHWPMWSEPAALTAILADIAAGGSGTVPSPL